MIYTNIEIERVRNQLSKEHIAEVLDVTTKTYNNYINGHPIPSHKLLKLSHVFNCSIDYLLGLKQERSIEPQEPLNEQRLVV